MKKLFTCMPVGSRTVHEHLLHGNELPKSLIRKIPPNNDSNTDNIKSPPGTLIRLERHPTSNSHNSPRTAPDYEQSQTRLEWNPTSNGHNSPRTAPDFEQSQTRLERHNSSRHKWLDRERSPFEVHPLTANSRTLPRMARSRMIVIRSKALDRERSHFIFCRERHRP